MKKKFGPAMLFVALVFIPWVSLGAGEKVDKKILKQVEVIETADPMIRKEVLIKMLEILDYEEISFEDLIGSSKDDVEARLTGLTAKAD
jgi:hypothetical protein